MTEMTDLPFLLDFYPLQGADETRIHPFFDALREGRFTTTRCAGCDSLLWQPRVVCPHCNSEDLEWVDLPTEGELYAATTVYAGLPMGLEDAAPMGIGIVELAVGGDEPLRVLSRIDDGEGLSIGDRVRFKTVDLPDGRVFYRFEARKE